VVLVRPRPSFDRMRRVRHGVLSPRLLRSAEKDEATPLRVAQTIDRTTDVGFPVSRAL
jgi:hypothetical protein